MLECSHVWKSFDDGKRRKTVLRGVTLKVPPGQALGVLAPPASGKSALLDLIANNTQPDRGSIRTAGKVSWLVGSRSWFARKLSPEENIRFIANVYGADPDAAADFTRAFVGVRPRDWFQPWASVDRIVKGRIAFAASLSIPCDVYIAEGDLTVGPGPFRERCFEALHQLKDRSAIVWMSRKPQPLGRVVTHYAVLKNGKLKRCTDREQAIERLGTEAA